MNNRKNNDLFNNEDYLIHETLYKYTIIHTMATSIYNLYTNSSCLVYSFQKAYYGKYKSNSLWILVYYLKYNITW